MQSVFTIKGLVADGDHTSDQMDRGFNACYLSIVYYSDDYMTTVTPTAGSSIVTGSETGEVFSAMENGTIDATNPDYDRPAAGGLVSKIKILNSGILGAVKFIATIKRF